MHKFINKITEILVTTAGNFIDLLANIIGNSAKIYPYITFYVCCVWIEILCVGIIKYFLGYI